MSSHKISLETPDRDLARRIAGALQDLIDPPPAALTVFEISDGAAPAQSLRVEAYFDEPTSVDDLRARLSDLLSLDIPALVESKVPEHNWVAISQSALPPVVAGRFTVHGTHDCKRIARGPNAILIDAGEAFGTAHHATTYGCLAAIDNLTRNRRFEHVLDIGTGSGVLAIALARALPRAQIMASDLDPRSIEVARENMKANGVAGHIRTVCATGLDAPGLRRWPACDLIVANILAEPLIKMAASLARKLAAGGTLVLSGLLIHQAPSVIAAYRAQGVSLLSHARHTGWSTLVLTKRAIAPAGRRA